MANRTEMIAADPYTKRVMEEQDYAAKNIEFWKNTNTTLKDTILQQGNTIVGLQAQLAEYQQRFGNLTPSPN